ncbi:hypothetical protein GCM10007108_02870 [Thermogymnomonas acidicola]|uniref:Uncharacterized protein n=1 Tax=Thermogymnomonas acidicola TaxID=399579 RepID=A0AA37BQ41_9ARCH|nr:hypothetical protein [Thermogymnomonas acidicola]GGM68225.1 hypothetical protein GCM10007108_02870 [Thermogymnomonas acidicola]
MSEENTIIELANECSLRYVQEFDYRYSLDRPPVNEAFLGGVIEIVRDIYPYIVGFAIERVYELVKKKITERMERSASQLIKVNKVLNVFGNNSVLLYGDVRPFFEIPKGSRLYFYNVKFQNKMPSNANPINLQTRLVIPEGVDLVLQNVTIVYNGELGKFIKEYSAPSVFLVRVYGIAS